MVDLTSFVAGPMATALLADQGADVVKVEAPGQGDLLRHIGCARGGLSAIFGTLNRNKRSVVVDLSEARGVELVRRLAGRADVFVQNFRPGVAEKLGIGEAVLRGAHPELVYVSLSGFGETGPYAKRRVYDSVMQALSGMAAAQASPKTGEPELVRNIVCDKVTALTAAQAITAALFARERGAGGQHLRLAMFDAAIAFLWPDGMQAHTYVGEGATPPAAAASYLAVRKAADGYLTISVIADAEFEGLCRALELPALRDDPRFADTASRLQHFEALGAALDRATRDRNLADLTARLAAEDVPHAPVNTAETLPRDPQVVANALLVESEHPAAGRMRMPRPPVRFEATPASLRDPAPLLGQHTEAVLAELGLAAAEIAELRTAGVVATGIAASG